MATATKPETGPPGAAGLRVARLDPAFVAAANARLPRDASAAAGAAMWQKTLALGLVGALAAGAALDAAATLTAALAALSVLIGATAALRLAVLIAALWPRRGVRPPDPETAPRLGLVVALRDEAAVLPVLLEALDRLEYPRDRLRVVLALEDDDPKTLSALEALAAERPAPGWLEVVVSPGGAPRTKPRALNAALDHLSAQGFEPELFGIFDAEDRPDPDMALKAAAALSAAPAEVACAQARLAYFNARENWISRCFAIEYATWFDVMMRGLARLDAPIPLGGSSVFFRVSALRALGGWDGRNVTEDADLGMRLAQAGRRCVLLDATTFEEAACRPGAWVRQRSRWLKGYLQTWTTLTRRPGRALRALGLWRFLAAQVLLLGAPLTALAQPIVVLAAADALARALGEGAGPSGTRAPGAMYDAMSEGGLAAARAAAGDAVASGMSSGLSWWWLSDWAAALGPAAPAMLAVLALGQAVMLLSALLGLWRTNQLGLAPWTLTLPFYWPLGALAAWKALVELVVAPFYWDKTRHGVGRYAARARAEALAARRAQVSAASSRSSAPSRSSAERSS